jgi:ABC-type Zn uptake system ZnuABC Zn-binding protein ZnuA
MTGPSTRSRRRRQPARLPRVAVLLAVVAMALAACGGALPSASDGTNLKVVATTTVFADLVAQVGGDRVEVASLVPKGGEVHTFDPTPSDIRRVVDADLIVRNGLGLDDWLAALVSDSGSLAPVVVLGEAYVGRIAEALSAADPDGAAGYAERAMAYGARLDELDSEIRVRLGAIPEADRVVISFHDAFPYFAAAYGLVIDGTIVEAPGQDPSAGGVDALVRAIRERGVRAILTEVQFNDELAQAIATETGARVVGDLYTDTLGDAPLDTYIAIMRSNTDRLVEALTGP